MDSKKITSYFLYSIGEILLVVIGILIAVSLNNWNDEKKDRQEELFYLEKLHKNLIQETASLRNTQNDITQLLDFIEYISVAIKDKDHPPLDNINAPLFRTVNYSPVTSTWSNLQSTGKISLITNELLNEKLYQYYNSKEAKTPQWKESIENYSRNIFGPFMMNFDMVNTDPDGEINLDFDYYQKTPYEYGQELLFRNALVYKHDMLNYASDRLKEDEELAKDLLTIIAQELNQRQD